MRLKKSGIVYGAKGEYGEWMDNSAMKPIPVLMGDVLRIYFTCRTKDGAGRPGYVDVNPENPSEVLAVCQKPLLELGDAGYFDDNGVVPCTVFEDNGIYYMYYTGFNLGVKVRMTYFSGLGISEDGIHFRKYSTIPVMERTEKGVLFRSVQCVVKEKDTWKVYYVAGDRFLQGRTKMLAVYELYCLETKDLTKLNFDGELVLPVEGDEYRIGAPQVVKEEGIYKMYYCTGTEDVVYDLKYAESKDGYHWERMDEKLNFSRTPGGWDSDMAAYPSVITCNGKKYMFYNGNRFGHEGFGYAEIVGE
jgi:predicted GH43/DUF377 family glycosyl hydrolase